ncbi:pantoate kinase [Methanococcoides methylutens]|uniref:Pantoate kinase n=1 Tax=Methanococcoides methylutens MM1 TaxID=1434104 RepID=A0A0E3ST49_METMT|nr:pantoate kinase [Methanococcoides methylutens]AKB85707.1 Pantoate kinase, archaeal [Methanococcoides methylutens MM1]
MLTEISAGRAFAPGHITGFFEIHDDPDPRRKGSTGCGIVINGGIDTVVTGYTENTEIILDGIPARAETTRSVIEQLVDFPVRVECTSSIPVGCGFGASAAGALSTAYALNDAFSLGMTSNQIVETVHIAEVINGSGMGDVEGQYFGGMPIRRSPGCPPHGVLDRVPTPSFNVHCIVLGELSTGSVLSDPVIMKEVNSAGRSALLALLSRPTVENFMHLSKQFTLKCGLASDRVMDAIEAVDSAGGMASQAMLGETVFACSANDAEEDIVEVLSTFGKVTTYRVTSSYQHP